MDVYGLVFFTLKLYCEHDHVHLYMNIVLTIEKMTAPAFPPAPTMPATVPVTFGLRYGTTPNVEPSAA